MLLIECGLVLAAVVVALIRPTLGSRWFEAFERKFSALARRRVLSVERVRAEFNTSAEAEPASVAPRLTCTILAAASTPAETRSNPR